MHVQSMAPKSALVTQMELELQQVKGAHSTTNKAHEGHIAQLIASINEMQELCTKQVGRQRRLFLAPVHFSLPPSPNQLLVQHQRYTTVRHGQDFALSSVCWCAAG